mmetsp:Transcript_148477/g.262135  ORF Transcript_148477/g.262135 Transcript_148477/m.262135 type:complete len:202 (+) Transcript_148477:107-712(+)
MPFHVDFTAYILRDPATSQHVLLAMLLLVLDELLRRRDFVLQLLRDVLLLPSLRLLPALVVCNSLPLNLFRAVSLTLTRCCIHHHPGRICEDHRTAGVEAAFEDGEAFALLIHSLSPPQYGTFQVDTFRKVMLHIGTVVIIISGTISKKPDFEDRHVRPDGQVTPIHVRHPCQQRVCTAEDFQSPCLRIDSSHRRISFFAT